MNYARLSLTGDLETLPRMPSWVTGKLGKILEDLAFLSGPAHATLHVVLSRPDIPHALLRDRLALRAVEACVGFTGRSEIHCLPRHTEVGFRPTADPRTVCL